MDYELMWEDLKVTLEELGKFTNEVNIKKIISFMEEIEVGNHYGM